jgi:hypothetical protein
VEEITCPTFQVSTGNLEITPEICLLGLVSSRSQPSSLAVDPQGHSSHTLTSFEKAFRTKENISMDFISNVAFE